MVWYRCCRLLQDQEHQQSHPRISKCHRDKHKGEHIGVFLLQSQGICELKHCSKKTSLVKSILLLLRRFQQHIFGIFWCHFMPCPHLIRIPASFEVWFTDYRRGIVTREHQKFCCWAKQAEGSVWDPFVPQWLLRVVSIFEGTNGRSQGFSSHSHKDLVGTPGGTRFSFFKDILTGGKEVHWMRLICNVVSLNKKPSGYFKAIVWQGDLT